MKQSGLSPAGGDLVPAGGGNVLVVDDGEQNRILLRAILERKGFQVFEAAGGEEALQKVRVSDPDVILLDVMMQPLDGFEVCRRLKADAAVAHIPVIMVTALVAREDRLRGMESGANDFLSKPVDAQDVLLRTRNAVLTKRLHDRVRDDYRKLKRLEQLRDDLTHLIVHDVKNNLLGLGLVFGMLQDTTRGPLNDRQESVIASAQSSLQGLQELIASMLDASRLEGDQMPVEKTWTDLAQSAGEAIEIIGAAAAGSAVSVQAEPGEAQAFCDPALLRRVFVNLIGNALKYAYGGGAVAVSIRRQTDGATEVRVTDSGPGIPAEYHEKIFEKFGQVAMAAASGGYSSGLGLNFCKLAIEAHGGRIGVESEVGQGSTFWFVLPGEPR